MEATSRRILASVLCASLLVMTTACYDFTGRRIDVNPRESRVSADVRIASLVTRSGDVVEFAGEARLEESEIVGKRPDGTKVRVPLGDVDRLTLVERKLNTLKTVGLVIGMIAGAMAATVAIVAATKQSCPFVYSWDGTRFVFDAEPYGGAVTRGLERADDTVLDFLRPSEGEFRLLLTNEVRETQMTNAISLRVVDAPPGTRIVPDDLGGLHTVRAPHPPLSARSKGRDLLPWLRASDELVLEQQPSLGPSGETRDEIEMTFPKPGGARTARLVVNAGTSLFGSYVIRESLALRGRELPAWYRAMDTDPAAVQALWTLIGREELWALKLEVLEPEGWTARGAIRGTGPLVVKDRVVPLDLAGTTGTTLTVRVRPPRGFWALNSFAVDYGPEEAFETTDVPLASARDSAGRDRRPELLAADDRYDEIPIGGDSVRLTFPVPPERPGTVRTVVLHAQGFYKLDLAGSGEPDRETLARLENEPGFGVRFAAERWKVWREARDPEARQAPR